MSNPVLQSIIQRLYVPDFIYTATNDSTYFTSPDRQSRSIFYGYDPMTSLPRYDLSPGIPKGASLQKIGAGIYAGTLAPTSEQNRSASRSLYPENQGNDVYAAGPSPASYRGPLPSRRSSSQAVLDSQTMSDRDLDVNPATYMAGIVFSRSSSQAVPVLERGYFPQPHPVRTGCIVRSPNGGDGSRSPGCNQFTPTQSDDSRSSSPGHAHPRLDARPGHHLDHLDDSIIAALAVKAYMDNVDDPRAAALTARADLREHFKTGRGPVADRHSRRFDFPLSDVGQDAVDVLLPTGQREVQDLSNDALRVLYVHLSVSGAEVSDPGQSPSDGNMSWSGRLVLQELKRRGFTEHLPHVPRLRGLRDDSDVSSNKADEIRAAGVPNEPTRRRNGRSHQHVNQASQSSTMASAGRQSKKKEGKAPVDTHHNSNSFEPRSAPISSDRTSNADFDKMRGPRVCDMP